MSFMDVEHLIRDLSERPEPFAPGDAELWADPLVAPQLLTAHWTAPASVDSGWSSSFLLFFFFHFLVVDG